MEVVSSRDGGETWGRPARILGWCDRPFLAVDGTSGKYRGRLYCNAADGVFTSVDSGKTFGPAVKLERQPGYGPVGCGNAVVLSDGRVAALYNGVRSGPDPGAAGSKRPPAYLAVRISRDGGATFGPERVVFEGPIASLPPSIAAAPRGCPYADDLFVIWKSDEPETGSPVLFSRSSDAGATWKPPVILSEQLGRRQVAQAGTVTHASYLPAIAVNRNGVVGVSWYDTRGLPVKQAGYAIRFRASCDGGSTWLPSVAISVPSTLWTAAVKQKYAQPEEEAGYWRTGPGHTAGLAAAASGIFQALWIDGRTGVRQVFTTAVDVVP